MCTQKKNQDGERDDYRRAEDCEDCEVIRPGIEAVVGNGEPSADLRSFKRACARVGFCQKCRRAADAGLWTRVDKQYVAKVTKHCKQGPHCWSGEQADSHRLLPKYLERIVRHIKGNIEEE